LLEKENTSTKNDIDSLKSQLKAKVDEIKGLELDLEKQFEEN